MAKYKIMIVEDEMDIMRAVAMRLRASGYDVVTASDAISATHLAMREAPDLYILDIGMPGGSGLMVAERLATNGKTMGSPFFFLSARTSPEDIAHAKEVGAFAYLTKPFKSEDLLETVTNALESVGKYADVA
jgi:DNA-binding response OmpR family regulator